MFTYLEIIGFFSGLIAVYLTTQQKILTFPIGIINVCISCFLFYQYQLYSDALLQIIYFALLIWGWIHWRKLQTQKHNLYISPINIPNVIVVVVFALIMGISLGYFFSKNTKADFPFFDAMLMSFSLAAQYLQSKKVIINWIFWIVVNLGYMLLYLQKDLDLYFWLYLAYLALAVKGYNDWHMQSTKNTTEL